MPSFSTPFQSARALALASIAAAMFAATSAPALAGDDGQAPIWTGLGAVVGISGLTGGKEKEPTIDYRERGRLVLPPKMILPPPMSAAADRTTAWPVDQEADKTRKDKEDRLAILKSQSDLAAMRDGHRVSPDTLRSDRLGPGLGRSANGACSSSSLRDSTCGQIPFHNVWEAIGLAKADEVVAGQEPDRDWLTDPPKGYRMPTTSTVATFDAKKASDRDPREYIRQQAMDRQNN
jgi:hypothetical protein